MMVYVLYRAKYYSTESKKYTSSIRDIEGVVVRTIGFSGEILAYLAGLKVAYNSSLERIVEQK